MKFLQLLLKPLYTWYRQGIRHPKYRWWVILGTLLYLISPINIASDAIPIVGWLDDGVITTMLVAEVSQLLLDRLKNRQNPNTAVPSAPVQHSGSAVDIKAVSVS